MSTRGLKHSSQIILLTIMCVTLLSGIPIAVVSGCVHLEKKGGRNFFLFTRGNKKFFNLTCWCCCCLI